MGALDNGFFDCIDPSPYYRDLRSLADDKAVLRNPHKGWYWHYIDNGYGRDNYRALHDPADHLTDFPGLNHLYLRFDWGDIEREEGVFDWSYIDAIMETWSAFDYRFAFRVCTYEGSSANPSLQYATPKWVYDAGARYICCANGALEPDYGDPVFLDKLARFMSEFGRRFDGDPRVELVDIGTFGTWGEGHTAYGTEKTWPVDVLKAHIDLHADNFPHKPILFNDDMVNHRSLIAPMEENRALVDYAVSRGCGARDDSVCVAYYSRTCGYNTLRTPFLFDHFWRQAPVDLEFEHYESVLDRPDDFAGGFPFLDALMRTHATFAGFHGYPRPWLKQAPYLTEYVANRIGYWYFLDGILIPPLHEGENQLEFVFHNRGYAPCYTRYEAKACLWGGDGMRYDFDLPSLDNRLWQPGETARACAALRLFNVPRGTYRLGFGLFEGTRPIELGIHRQYRQADGYYDLAQVIVE